MALIYSSTGLEPEDEQSSKKKENTPGEDDFSQSQSVIQAIEAKKATTTNVYELFRRAVIPAIQETDLHAILVKAARKRETQSFAAEQDAVSDRRRRRRKYEDQ